MNVLGVEYPGYSIYEGKPNEQKIYDDLEGILVFVQKSLMIELSKVILVGRSLGTGPVIELATRCRVGCMVLISPFSSIKEVVKNMVGSFGQLFIKQRFDNLSKAPRVKCPTLILHGEKDALVPAEHAKKIYGEFCFSSRFPLLFH